MSGHTPGPWVAVENSHYWEINVAGSHLSVASACPSNFLPEGNNGEANACLIAAAPELLEAAKGLVRWCDENPPAGGALYFVELARAAIAKAEGRP